MGVNEISMDFVEISEYGCVLTDELARFPQKTRSFQRGVDQPLR